MKGEREQGGKGVSKNEMGRAILKIGKQDEKWRAVMKDGGYIEKGKEKDGWKDRRADGLVIKTTH